MSRHEHRLGVSEINLVHRHFRLLRPVNLQNLDRAISEIDGLHGLDEISFDKKSCALHLSYDASRLCIEGVEEILKKNDIR